MLDPTADDPLEDPEDYFGLAYLDFADCRYIIKKECVILGRPPESHLTLAEIADPAAEPDSPSRKRKRSDVDLDDAADDVGASDADSQGRQPLFQGGLGGPQEHGPSYLDEDAEFVYMWPPADELKGQPPNLKAISKRHLRFLFDGQDRWQLDVLGRNGVLINRDFFPQSSHVLIHDGDSFWVADVHFTFNIPPLVAGDVGYSGNDEDVSAAMYDSEEADSNEGSYDVPSGEEDAEQVDDDEDEDEEDDEDDGEGSVVSVQRPPKTGKRVPKPKPRLKEKAKPKKGKPRGVVDQDLSDSDQELPTIENGESADKPRRPKKLSKSKMQKGIKKSPRGSEEPNAADDEEAPKKRGPGRPPKDGVMSKRARRALQKAAELDRDDGDVTSGKVKGRPRKPSEANEQSVNGEPKKPKKPKRAQNDADGKDGEDKQTDETTANEEPAPPPPPREPSPKETDFQEHELQKPDKPYSVCLYNVLRESERSLALPEIYEAFKKRWPYFRFRTGGDGWQSSIRHNLQSTKCLVKDGKAGKGHLWTVDPNIPLDNRTTSRNELASLPQPYYGQPGQASSMLSGQNQHLPMRAPPNVAFAGQQNMHQYHMSYMNTNANGQRLPQSGVNSGVQQYQTSQNQSQLNAHRPLGQGVGAGGISQQTNSTAQHPSGPAQTSSQSQQAQFNQIASNSLNSAAGVNGGATAARVNGAQPSAVQNSSIMQSSAAGTVGTFSPEKLAVFESFRNRLLGMAQNEGQKKYYSDILELGQVWCAQHPELGARYDGPRTDISQIVKAFQDAWENHLKKSKGGPKDQTPGASSSSSPVPTQALAKTAAGHTGGVSPGPATRATPVANDGSVGQKLNGIGSQPVSGDPNSKASAPPPMPNMPSDQVNGEQSTVEGSEGGAQASNDGRPASETAKTTEIPAAADIKV